MRERSTDASTFISIAEAGSKAGSYLTISFGWMADEDVCSLGSLVLQQTPADSRRPGV
jgi:hypothetical protein